jgi:hypothetical protein
MSSATSRTPDRLKRCLPLVRVLGRRGQSCILPMYVVSSLQVVSKKRQALRQISIFVQGLGGCVGKAVRWPSHEGSERVSDPFLTWTPRSKVASTVTD